MLTLVLRFAHVFFGALWVGMMAYQTFYLMPALAEAGPDAGKVMGGLLKRRVPMILPVFALITIVAGMWLFQRMSGGNMSGFMATAMGKGFAFGGAVAVLAFLIGMVVARPAAMRAMKLGESLTSAPPDRRAAIATEMQRARARGDAAAKLVAWMLLFTLAVMAVARYL